MATDNITFKCTDKGKRGDGRREGRQADTDADSRSRSSKCLHLLCHKNKKVMNTNMPDLKNLFNIVPSYSINMGS